MFQISKRRLSQVACFQCLSKSEAFSHEFALYISNLLAFRGSEIIVSGMIKRKMATPPRGLRPNPAAVIIVAAFSEEHVERLTGITISQLRYWDRTKFFVPSYADENRRAAYSRIYSFKDVAALKTISILRNSYDVPLQHLRKVGKTLAHLSDDLWITQKLYVWKRRVHFDDPTTRLKREVVSGQFVMPTVDLHPIITDVKEAVTALRAREATKIGQVERSRFVNHNAWVVAGTRIATSAIRRFKEAGYSDADIILE
ncbi:MAG: MerR family transcriptional regulator, partial [Terriglobales bacterium]